MSVSFPLDGMRVRFAGTTNIGKKRAHNEDSIHVPTDDRLVIVADGMGGHASGDIASQTAVATVAAYFRATSNQQVLTWPYKIDGDLRAQKNRMKTAILMANQDIWEKSRAVGGKGMGTTCVCAYFVEDHVVVGHVGDSRCYRLRDGELVQLTEDHSLLNDHIKTKRLTAEEAKLSPQKNVVMRALGMKEAVQVDVLVEVPRIGDVFLLCSDGLSGMLTDAQIAHILDSERDLDRAAEVLIDAANDEGGVDNISAVLARMESV